MRIVEESAKNRPILLFIYYFFGSKDLLICEKNMTVIFTITPYQELLALVKCFFVGSVNKGHLFLYA